MNPELMNVSELATCYRLIAELLVYPPERNKDQIDLWLEQLSRAPAAVREPLQAFIETPSAWSPDEYVRTLELSPPCPLYLGSYVFDEPKSCRGAGMSGRNAYMIELANIYRHFGVDRNGKELADFLPLMVDFLAISLAHPERDDIGLRRRYVEHYFTEGLSAMKEALDKYESAYALVIEALSVALEDDTSSMAGQPIWTPPKEDVKPPVAALSH